MMYGYYILSSLQSDSKKYVWWKKYVTQVQILQFALTLFIVSVSISIDCDYPKVVSAFIAIQACFMTALFSDFYYKNYVKKAK